MKKTVITTPDKTPAAPALLPVAIVEDFYKDYIATARRQLADAKNDSHRFALLRTICQDATTFRHAGHQLERLDFWKEKLLLDIAGKKTANEETFLKWAKQNPAVLKKAFPPRRKMSYREQEERMRQILGLSKLPFDQKMGRAFVELKDLMNYAEKPKHRKKIAAEMAAFRKWLDQYHPADPKIEVSAVENKV
jgi:hypothetical protein